MATVFVERPGRSGPFGALLDEYARAAAEFCRVAEAFDAARFNRPRPSNDPDTVSPRAVCLHVCGAAHRYAHYIRAVRGIDFVERFQLPPEQLVVPADVGPRLAEGVRLMEDTVEPFFAFPDEAIQRLSFVVRWGPTYDPEMMLEHAVCHLLRHRRQLERW